MAVTSNCKITVTFTGDFEYSQEYESVQNIASPGYIYSTSMTSPGTAITVPTGAVGVIIILADNNIIPVALRGDTGTVPSGDIGINLALTGPTYVALRDVVGGSISLDTLDPVIAGTIGLRIIFV